MRAKRCALAALAAGLISSPAPCGDGDYYLSVPLKGAIWRVDADTLQGAAFAEGLLIPHYGHFIGEDLYMPDRGHVGILRIEPDGTPHAHAAGGLFQMPVTCLPARDGSGIIVSDMAANRILHVDWLGQQTLIADAASTGFLLDWPDGLAYDAAGNLYVANLVGNTIIRIGENGSATLFSDSPLIDQPGGIAIDGSGNLFAAMYNGNRIVRFRLDTGEAEEFAADPEMLHPSDLKLARGGGLLTTTRKSNLLRVDAAGAVSVVFQDSTLGEIVGIAVPEDATPCSGSFVPYGSGLAGSGGFVPRLSALFSPCPGEAVALELRDFAGGAPCFLFLGAAAGAVPAMGGTLLVDLTAPWLMIGFPLPGNGAGEGDALLPFTLPALPELSGLQFHYQAVAVDPGAPSGVSFSNGLRETIGH